MSGIRMTTRATPSRSLGAMRGMTFWDSAAIISLGLAGFLFSYDALREIAVAIHARESLSYLFPIFIDGFLAYGVRAIVLLRGERLAARVYAWMLFLSATGASLGANALHAVTLNRSSGPSALHLGDRVVGGLSMLAPLALAGAVHLYILMARTAERSVPDGSNHGPQPSSNVPSPPLPAAPPSVAATGGPEAAVIRPSPDGGPLPVPAGLRTADAVGPRDGFPAVHAKRSSHGPAEPDGPSTAVPDQEESGQAPGASGQTTRSAVHDGDGGEEAVQDGAGPRAQPDGPTSQRPAQGGPEQRGGAPAQPILPTVHDDADGPVPAVQEDVDLLGDREAEDDWLEDLLPIARRACTAAGGLSRDSVGRAIRAHQPISNERLGVLLARLRDEKISSAATPVGASSSP